MSKSIIAGLFLSLLYSFSYAQEDRLEKLNALQNQLDQMQIKGNDSIDKGKIYSISSLKFERDSLQTLVELLRAELLLLDSKLKKTENKLVSLSSGKKNDDSIGQLKGYYVVVKSERSKTDIQDKYIYMQKKYPLYSFKIIQNERKSWFHICIAKGYNEKDEVRMAVQEAKDSGIQDAWWIELN